MNKNRLVDRVHSNDWSNLTNDIEMIVAKKIHNKIQGYVNELKTKGSFSPIEE